MTEEQGNVSINQFLVEQSGECWHEGDPRCEKCGRAYGICDEINPDFSKWKNFGRLLEIARKHTTQITILCPVVLKNTINIFTLNSQTGDTMQNISTDDIPRIAAELVAKALGWEEPQAVRVKNIAEVRD